MSALEILALPAFEDNYIWALRRAGHVAVVDPGDAVPVFDHLEETGDRLCAILVTHHHGDHTGGLEALVADLPVPVYAPANEPVETATHPLNGGERIELPELDLTFDVLAVPGHTRGHLAYYACAEPGHAAMVFCGDTLFGAGCGKIFDGTVAQLHASLARLAALPGDTRVYCAHEYTQSCLRFAGLVEPDNAALKSRTAETARVRTAGRPSLPSTIELERATNPFLRCHSPAVIAAVTRHLGHAPRDEAETFAALRDWRNHS